MEQPKKKKKLGCLIIFIIILIIICWGIWHIASSISASFNVADQQVDIQNAELSISGATLALKKIETQSAIIPLSGIYALNQNEYIDNCGKYQGDWAAYGNIPDNAYPLAQKVNNFKKQEDKAYNLLTNGINEYATNPKEGQAKMTEGAEIFNKLFSNVSIQLLNELKNENAKLNNNQ